MLCWGLYGVAGGLPMSTGRALLLKCSLKARCRVASFRRGRRQDLPAARTRTHARARAHMHACSLARSLARSQAPARTHSFTRTRTHGRLWGYLGLIAGPFYTLKTLASSCARIHAHARTHARTQRTRARAHARTHSAHAHTHTRTQRTHTCTQHTHTRMHARMHADTAMRRCSRMGRSDGTRSSGRCVGKPASSAPAGKRPK